MTEAGRELQVIVFFLPNYLVLLLNLNDAQADILLTFLTLCLTFHPTLLFFNCLQQNSSKYWLIMRTQA